MPSTSAPNLRTRHPLAPLPISRFVHPANTLPSPVSLPLKRNAPSPIGSSSASTIDSPKIRKVSVTEDDGVETIKRTRVKNVTPKARSILDKDELGMGQSPARRLFMDQAEGRSLGIVGAVPAPPSPSSISIQPPPRSLAPSPPISSRSNRGPFDATVEPTSPILNTQCVENNMDVHDVGFTIHVDGSAWTGAPLTPDSRRHISNPALAWDAPSHIPSSPASSSRSYLYDENQENIPPALSYSASTPSKSSRSSSALSSPASRRSTASHTADEDWLPGSGSRHRRAMERSKLGLEIVIGMNDDETGRELEELTPGKRTIRKTDVRLAKAGLAREVNRI